MEEDEEEEEEEVEDNGYQPCGSKGAAEEKEDPWATPIMVYGGLVPGIGQPHSPHLSRPHRNVLVY